MNLFDDEPIFNLKEREAFVSKYSTTQAQKLDQILDVISKEFPKQQVSINAQELLNLYTGALAHIPYDKNLGISIFEIYEEIGSPWVFALGKSYMIPLVFDYDCIKCKNGECLSKPRRGFVEQYLPKFIELLKVLFGKNHPRFVIFKSNLKCNFHIYCEVVISLPLYNLILNYFKNNNPSFISPFILDDILELATPWGLIPGKDKYTPITLIPKGFSVINNNCQRDINLLYHASLQNETMLATFSRIENNDEELIDETVKPQYLYAPTNFIDKIINCESMNASILRSFRSSISTTDIRLELFVNNFTRDLSKFAFKRPDPGVYTGNSSIFVLFLKLVYTIEGNDQITESEAFIYFAAFLQKGGTENFEPILVTTFFYLRNRTAELRIENTDEMIVEILQIVVGCFEEDELRVLAEHIVNCISKRKKQLLKETIFSEPAKILKYFITQIKIAEHYHGDLNKYLYGIATSYSVEKRAILFLQYNMIAVKVDGKLLFYLKETGNYDLAPYKKAAVSANLIRWLYSFGKEKKIQTDYMEQYMDEIFDKSERQVNCSVSYINTRRGVFSTITGLYQKHAPFYYFTTSRAYGPIASDNLSLLRIYAENKNLIESMSLISISLFYEYIVFPGVVSLNNGDFYYKLSDTTNWVKNINPYFTQTPLFMIKENLGLMYNLITFHPQMIRRIQLVCEATQSTDPVIIGKIYSKTGWYENERTEEGIYNYIIEPTDVSYESCPEFVEEYCSMYKTSPLKLMTYLFITFIITHELMFEEKYQIKEKFNFGGQTLNYYPLSIDKPLRELILILNYTFGFDGQAVRHFLYSIAHLYSQLQPRRWITFLLGPPMCGKSTIQNFISKICAGSVYQPLEIKLKSGPDEEAKAMLNCHAVLIREMSYLSRPLVNVLLGGDEMSFRSLYRSVENRRAISLFLGASNTLPVIPGPNESLRKRLYVHKFFYTFITQNDAENSGANNTLYLFLTNSQFIKQSIREEELAQQLALLIYLAYEEFRDEEGFCCEEITNKDSLEIIPKILSENHPLYNLIDRAGYVYQKGTSSRRDEMLSAMSAIGGDKFKLEESDEAIKVLLKSSGDYIIDWCKKNEQFNYSVKLNVSRAETNFTRSEFVKLLLRNDINRHLVERYWESIINKYGNLYCYKQDCLKETTVTLKRTEPTEPKAKDQNTETKKSKRKCLM